MWTTARGAVDLNAPRVAGILNVTPDSFSDGGEFLDVERAVAHAEQLLEEGAHLIDVGGESTRPGRPRPATIVEEWRRIGPVVTELARRFPNVPLSVDTYKAEVARRALAAGAWIINDVSGFRLDADMPSVCAAGEAGVILMHSRGTAANIATYDHADYDDVIGEVRTELAQAVDVALDAGVAGGRIVIDPGLGFAKRPEHNWAVLRDIEAFASLGYPVMVGPSRKRFLRQGLENRDSWDRATAEVCVAARRRGAALFRVHAVALVVEALEFAQPIRST